MYREVKVNREMYNDTRRGNMGGGGFVPVKVGQELDVKIDAVGAKGDGIAKVEGFVLFVPSVKEGDNVRIRVTKVLRNVGFAEAIGEAGSAPAAEPEAEALPEDSEDFGEESDSASDDDMSDDDADDSPADEEEQ